METHADDDAPTAPDGSWPVDVAGAALVTLAVVLLSRHLAPTDGERAIDGWAYGFVLVGGVALGFLRRRPRTAFAVVAAALVGYVASRYPNGPIFVMGWISLFVLSWKTDRRDAIVGATALCVALPVAVALAGGGLSLLPLVFVGWSAAAVLLGDAVRQRQVAMDELRARARQLEQTREEETRRHLTEERLRIARDLHDSVAHSMATINVQAGVAAHVVDRRPEAAKEALTAIRLASGDVLDELAAMLRLLRADDDGADRAPTPGLDQIGALVVASREAHLPVSLTVEGATDSVPRPVGVAAYRIVQESLTNAIRHAHPTQVQVTVRASETAALEIEVADDGSGPPTAGQGDSAGRGMGIRGMRERAEATGGHLDASPRAGGGFLVCATWAARP